MKIVQKYGGSSLADPECVTRVANRVLQDAEGNEMLVVVSAQGKTTDSMTRTYKTYSDRFPSRESDAMLACGEQISAALLVAAIQKSGRDAIALNASQVPILANGTWGDGRIEKISTAKIKKEWKKGKIVVVTGFQGINKYGEWMTLGRGGSDTSAVALAAALKADKCQIFTDVNGVYSADPGKIPTAVKFDSLAPHTMLNLALGGAKVLHPRAAQLALQYDVPLEILSSFSHTSGTVLSADSPRQKGITRQSTENGDTTVTVTFAEKGRSADALSIIKEICNTTSALSFCRYTLSAAVPTEGEEIFLKKLHDILFV